MMKIFSWNVNSLKVRWPHLELLITQEAPDVICLQETKVEDHNFPREAIEALGYHVIYAGQKTYNGVAILSKISPADCLSDFRDAPDPQRRLLACTIGNLRLINVYVPNGESPISLKYPYKLEWLEKLNRLIQEEYARHPNILIVGDFNIAPQDVDVHNPKAWEGQILCTDAERAALQKLFDLGLQDIFRLFQQPEASYSWWDYRARAYARNHGARIDLMLATPELCKSVSKSWIDTHYRGLERPSDHTPVGVILQY